MADGLEGRSAPGTEAPPAAVQSPSVPANVVVSQSAAATAAASATANATASAASVASATAPSLPVARALPGEHQIARLLRIGAVMAGSCFASSLCFEFLPPSKLQAQAIDLLREAGAMLLIMTPITRLIAAGVMLGIRGEWRYALYAGVILTLVSLALGAGMHA